MSFPSGHAQSAVVAASVLLLVFLPLPARRLARRSPMARRGRGTCWRSASRASALGVHYVSDVLAGYVLGAAWVAAMIAAFNAWRRERGRPAADPAQGLEPGLRAAS